MMRAILSLMMMLSSALHAGEADLVEVRSPHLRVLTSATNAATLRSTIARADAMLCVMAKDAGVVLDAPLTVWLSDLTDLHNGFSTTVPTPLVQTVIADAPPSSEIFAGEDQVLRTLIHEFAHHLCNDPTPDAVRASAQRVFGRVIPSDPLSIPFFMLTAPGHVSMPSFWHEGVAQWAETVYAEPGALWAGRGRDSLVHMVWRMDALAQTIPQPADWSLVYERWPYGARSYLYGLAYTRWLASRFADRAEVWQFVRAQQQQLPFVFSSGAERVVGVDHATLIADMRGDLQREFDAQLALLRAGGAATRARTTPPEWRWSAPAWLGDGRLAAIGSGQRERSGLFALRGAAIEEKIASGGAGGVRRSNDGALIWSRPSPSWKGRFVMAPVLRTASGARISIDAPRVFDCDARSASTGWLVAGVQRGDDGSQRIVVGDVSAQGAWREQSSMPVVGRPWLPAWRPGHDVLSWVETDAQGSRVVAAPLATPASRSVLLSLRGRVLHPTWSSDGMALFLCSDVSGVPNAYRFTISDGALRPITNTLSGVTACVPSPDGTQLAIVEHDQHGPFVATLDNDERQWPRRLPLIELAWPAVVSRSASTATTATIASSASAAPRVLPDGAGIALSPAQPYQPLWAMRPLFWTPTMLPVAEGGIGVKGVVADPLFVNVLEASIGRGPENRATVGRAAWTWSGMPWQVAVFAQQAEITYDQQLLASNGEHPLITRVPSAGLRFGVGFDAIVPGPPKPFVAYLELGIERPFIENAEDWSAASILGPQPFTGQERYVQAVAGFDTRRRTAVGYTPGHGGAVRITARSSGLGGDLEGWLVRADGAWTQPLWGEADHQVVVGGSLGLGEDSAHAIQQRFIAGSPKDLGLPRGYSRVVATGTSLLGGSLGYRVPFYRPFAGFGTRPWRLRQLVGEVFADGAIVGDRSHGEALGQGRLVRSVGAELRADLSFTFIDLDPGLGIARQSDGREDTTIYFSMGYRW